MQCSRNPAADMIAKRFVAAATVLCLGLALGSCSAGSIADHWPRWAGGMPPDVPPRPGAPGYDEFIAHGQANKDAATPALADDKTNMPPLRAPAQVTPVAAAPPGGPPPVDSPTVQGGLY
jgi:hypothetical protein